MTNIDKGIIKKNDKGKKKLIIVESRTKAKEISAFLGSGWTILPTNGFLKDIIQPKNVPDTKKDDYGRYGVKTSGDFDALLAWGAGSFKTFQSIKKEVDSGKYDTIVFSGDPDRAGHHISRQTYEALKTSLKKQGMAAVRAYWHEITKKAVIEGLEKAVSIDDIDVVREVEADEARFAYDRLFGYSVSPLLWKAVSPGTSGGRAQSPALRLVVERERERLAFVSAEYYGITGMFSTNKERYPANLISIDGKRVATGASFDEHGKPKKDVLILSKSDAASHVATMKSAGWKVTDVSEKAYRRTPPKPYKTSSFQQDVGNRLGMSAKKTMSIAQKLFERGRISYLRTDAETMSDEGTDAAYATAKKEFPSSLALSKRRFTAKKNAQEGHEAIRPIQDDVTGLFPTTASIKKELDSMDKDAAKVYDLIRRRTIASQMKDAIGRTITITLENTSGERKYVMTSVGTVITDPGWTVVLSDTSTTPVPSVNKDDDASVVSMEAQKHETQPPARFTEPQLVAKLEELGIGRPATYAQIVSVNQERDYVKKKGKALYPTWRGMQVAAILEAKLAGYVDYGYSADMEEELDDIAAGTLSKKDFLSKQWKGIDADVNGLAAGLKWDEVNALSTIPLQGTYVVRCSKSGCWLEDTSQAPDKDGYRKGYKLDGDELADGMDEARCDELIKAAKDAPKPRELGALTSGVYQGYAVTLRTGKFGNYAQAVKPNAKKTDKAVNMTLPKEWNLEDIALSQVEPLFAETKLPRQLGKGFFTGLSKNPKKPGAWLGFSKGKTRRAKATFISLPEDKDPRTLTLEEAEALWDESGKKK